MGSCIIKVLTIVVLITVVFDIYVYTVVLIPFIMQLKVHWLTSFNEIHNVMLSAKSLGLCDNGKSDISISAIIFYRFISINDIISIIL